MMGVIRRPSYIKPIFTQKRVSQVKPRFLSDFRDSIYGVLTASVTVLHIEHPSEVF